MSFYGLVDGSDLLRLASLEEVLQRSFDDLVGLDGVSPLDGDLDRFLRCRDLERLVEADDHCAERVHGRWIGPEP